MSKGEQKILPDFVTFSLSLPQLHTISLKLFLHPDCFLSGLGAKYYLFSNYLVSFLEHAH